MKIDKDMLQKYLNAGINYESQDTTLEYKNKIQRDNTKLFFFFNHSFISKIVSQMLVWLQGNFGVFFTGVDYLIFILHSKTGYTTRSTYTSPRVHRTTRPVFAFLMQHCSIHNTVKVSA